MPTTILGITSGPILELCHAVGSEKNQFFGNVVLHALFAQCFEADVNTHFLKSFLTYTCAKLLSFLKTIFEGHQSFLWGHWYPYFGLLVMSALGFKAWVNPRLHAMDSPDWPLVQHLLTSWWPAQQPSHWCSFWNLTSYLQFYTFYP